MKYFSLFLTLSLLTVKLNGSPFSESKIVPWGVDSELVPNDQKYGSLYFKQEKSKREKPPLSLAQKSCRAAIRFFQIYISPIDGPRSSFYPTSSQYALEAIQKHGVLKGIGMGCDRLLRENDEKWIYDLTDRYGILRKLDPIR
jgi:putative membrane protein insertion efficiency factor